MHEKVSIPANRGAALASQVDELSALYRLTDNLSDRQKILLVEDEVLIAAMVVDMLEGLGATVIGPATSLETGLSLAGSEDIDAAVLDVSLRGKRIAPIAEVLVARGVPVVFATGDGRRREPPEGMQKPSTSPIPRIGLQVRYGARWLRRKRPAATPECGGRLRSPPAAAAAMI